MALSSQAPAQGADAPSPMGHIASRPGRNADRAMIDPTTEEGLRRAGYVGFVTIGALREAGLVAVPDEPGVYLALYPAAEEPRFLPVSPAAEIGRESATIPVGELEDLWVSGALVLYAGLAGGKGRSATLRTRIGQYLDFGRGQKVRHRDGRAVWQVVRSSTLIMCWLPTPGADPWGKRNSLLTAFRERHGSPPFANRTGQPAY